MGRSKFLRLTAICLVSSTVSNNLAFSLTLNTAAERVGLAPRQAKVCGGKQGYEQCGANFPDEFCCGGGTTCQGFDAGRGKSSGVICCPQGGSCETFQPIECESSAFNATLHPDNPIHISFASSADDLPTCNGKCCPPGYRCDGSTCTLGDISSSVSISSTVSLSSAASATSGPKSSSTPADSPASDATSTSESSTSGSVSSSCELFPSQAILVGFFPGMIAGSIVTFLIILCMGRLNRKRKGVRKDSDSAIGPIRAHISDPIYQGENERIDFLRRNTRTGKMSPPGTCSTASSPPLTRVRSLFSRTPATGSPEKFAYKSGLGVSSGGVPHVPKTPERQLRREPSMESIVIMSPPETRGDMSHDRQTTFGDVLKAVGLEVREPMPYMPSPGLVDPRARGVDNGNIRRIA